MPPNPFIEQVAAGIRDAFVRDVQQGRLEATKDYAPDGGYLGIIFREPVLAVPKRNGTWTECAARAKEACRNREPVEIPGMVGAFRVREVFPWGVEFPLEWDGSKWVEGSHSRASRSPGFVSCVWVRVEPWEEVPKSQTPPPMRALTGLTLTPFRVQMSLPDSAFHPADLAAMDLRAAKRRAGEEWFAMGWQAFR